MHLAAAVLDRLGLEAPAPDWQHRARCRGIPPATSDSLFFSEPGMDPQVFAYCSYCPVWEACLASEVLEAVTIHPGNPVAEVHGIRAAMTQHERRRLLADGLARVAPAEESA